jgi:3-hydroxyisobutyrate dehydrogenase-like beta-hydroxyacid dehydrogenase
MAQQQRIGFIGVGLMGHGMARNILEKGYRLTICGHRNRQPVEDLVGRGAKQASSPADLARQCEILFLCLPSSREVEAVVQGDDGIIAGAHPGLIVVDSTTADPNSTLRVAQALSAQGVRMADAPLTRTPKEAEEGRLNVLVGADPSLLEEIKPVLAAFVENIFHAGPLGAGHKMKLLNNFIALANASVVAEAVTAARKLGLDLAKVHEIISAGGANSNMFQMIMPWVLEGDASRLQFAIRNAQKDLRYFGQLASEASLALAIPPAVHNAFALASAAGHGEDFVPQLADALSGLNGVSG